MDYEREKDAKQPKKFSWYGIKSPEELTEEKAWQLFRHVRWNGKKPKCLYCGHVGVTLSKHRRLYICPICRRKFTDRHKTPYCKARVPMRKIIFFIVLVHGGIPVNKIYQVLCISKTAALRLSVIIKTRSIAKKILKHIQIDTSLTVEKIIYYLAPEFDSTFKRNKEYHLSLKLANKDLPRCGECGSYNVIMDLLRRSVKCQQCSKIDEVQDEN
jgi:transposase-like protein